MTATIRPGDLAIRLAANAGMYEIAYNDIYVEQSEYWPICSIEFDLLPADGTGDGRIANAFTVVPSIYDTHRPDGSSLKNVLKGSTNHAAKVNGQCRKIEDAYIASLVRSGMLRPRFDGVAIESLGEANGAIIIPDTNAILNGALHYVTRHFSSHIGYVGIPEDVEKELKTKTNDFKTKVDNLLKKQRQSPGASAGAPKEAEDWSEIPILRGFAQNAVGALRKGILPVEYEVLPIQASSLKSAGEDGEIIRTVAEFLRKRHATAPVYFITYDYNMARFCHMRQLNVIFCRQPKLDDVSPTYSIRYDARTEQLVFVDLADLLWELAYAFNTVQLRAGDGKLLTLMSHNPESQYSNWINNEMHIDEEIPVSTNASDHAAKPRVFDIGFLAILKGVKHIVELPSPVGEETLVEHTGATKGTVKELLAFGLAFNLWKINSAIVTPLPGLGRLYAVWVEDGAEAVARWLLDNYTSFQLFYGVLSSNKSIDLRDDVAARSSGLSSRQLKYFPKICELTNLGRTIEGRVVWTGDTISLIDFEICLLEAYRTLRGSREFVGVAELVNALYDSGNISHDFFQTRFSELVSMKPDFISITGSVALQADRKNSFEVLVGPAGESIVRRVNLEDGFLLGSRTVKGVAMKIDERAGNV